MPDLRVLNQAPDAALDPAITGRFRTVFTRNSWQYAMLRKDYSDLRRWRWKLKRRQQRHANPGTSSPWSVFGDKWRSCRIR